MAITTICFDLDDTLYNYEQYARAGLRNAASVLESKTGRDLERELLALYFEKDQTDGTFDLLVERYDLSEKLVPALVRAYHDANAPLTPYPAAEPLLANLSREFSLGLITDGQGGHSKLERLGIESYFDEVLVTPTVDRSKEDRVVFDRTLDALDSRPADAAYVGDDPRVDFRWPNRLGMRTVRLQRGRYAELDPDSQIATADYRISSLISLVDVIKTC